MIKRLNWLRGAGLAGLLSFAMLGPVMVVTAQEATPGTELMPYEPGEGVADLEGSIASDGSSTVFPITQAVAEEFLGIAANVDVRVDFSGTGGGFERFCKGETAIQNASRPIKPEEVQACAETGVDFYEFAVAFDGLAVVTNADNDYLECLTVEELATLWAPDSEILSWNQLNPEFPEEEVILYGPGTDSGTFDYFTEEIVGEVGASRTDYTPSEDDNVLVQGVLGDTSALGYFGYAYYEQNQDGLKLIAVDSGDGCVIPSAETIADGSYTPLSRPLFVYVKAESLMEAPVQEFMRFYVANAPELALEVGYFPLPGDGYAQAQQKLEAAISGEGEPDGPTGMATPTS
jgi:phosphate transport system substrate-binding protein